MLALASFALLILVGRPHRGDGRAGQRAADWVAHSLEVQARATDLLSKAQDLKLAKRGYLSDEVGRLSASPIDEARAAIPQALAKLRSLVADNPDQTARVERMRACRSTKC